MRCRWCNKIFKDQELTPVNNGKTTLVLCKMCKSQWDWQKADSVTPPRSGFDLGAFFRKLFGKT